MQLNKEQLSAALGENLVKITGDFSFKNYSIDTRTIMQGDCFIAIKGNNDGHQYLQTAIAKGAAALIIEEEYYKQNTLSFSSLIIVKDTLIALAKIASYNAKAFKEKGGVLIGITGSVGKTTLKEMLAFVLAKSNIVSATFGNYNNHIGLPFSVAHIKDEAQFGVYEMGMSSSGEISYLSHILQPQVGIITEITSAHTEFFKDGLDGVAAAKAEIMDGMDAQSLLFLNYDNSYFSFLKEKAIEHGIKKIISFSQSNKDADIYVESTKLLENYQIEVYANIFGEGIVYKINSITQHNAMLATLALGIAKKLHADITKALEKFIDFKIPKGRGEILQIKFNDKNIVLIDDSYNANPKSMNSALLSLQNSQSKKIIILGSMLELGIRAQEEHIKLKDSLAGISNIKEIILVGDLMEHLYKAIADTKAQHFNNTEDAMAYLKNIIEEGDLVFIKGSLGSGVINISKYLQNPLDNL
ncbi:MAG: UDP-N-acetylmuramoyl-tripeptide--D-alanyl-D-alanine ligase [Alphaproteobacteria bacterium]|nr:UDP-N-acetylmuramoyl-tripeptide--D-alanyl-D-alanine ligase [Alphaproteobacteria bacterium]